MSYLVVFLSFLLSWRTNASLMIGPLMPRSRELRTLLVPCWSVSSEWRLMTARLCPGSCRLKLRILRCKRTDLQVVVHSLRGPSVRARSSVCGRVVTPSLLPCSASQPCCDRLSQARCSAPWQSSTMWQPPCTKILAMHLIRICCLLSPASGVVRFGVSLLQALSFAACVA